MAKRVTEAKLRQLVAQAVQQTINRECHRAFGELRIPEGVRIVGGGVVHAKDEPDERNDNDRDFHDGAARYPHRG